jgi:hypothetical protein
MMQPHPSQYTHGLFVMGRPPGRLGKRGPLRPSHDRARLTPQDRGQSRTMSAPVAPHARAGLHSPPEQCARIAVFGCRQSIAGAERRTRLNLGGEAVE